MTEQRVGWALYYRSMRGGFWTFSEFLESAYGAEVRKAEMIKKHLSSELSDVKIVPVYATKPEAE